MRDPAERGVRGLDLLLYLFRHGKANIMEILADTGMHRETFYSAKERLRGDPDGLLEDLECHVTRCAVAPVNKPRPSDLRNRALAALHHEVLEIGQTGT